MNTGAKMVEKAKSWFQGWPPWVPICFTILGAAVWVGQYTQSINDRLKSLEEQVKQIQEYMRTTHAKKDMNSTTDLPSSYVPQ